MRWHQHLWQQGRHHLFKGSAFIVTVILFVAAFVFAPDLMTKGLDANHELVKEISNVVKAWDPVWGSRFELFLRFFNLDRILLFAEAVAVVKLIMQMISLVCSTIFRVCTQKVLTKTRKR
jgi:hypothetical protein